MARLKWGDHGSQVVEAGVSQGVLYPGTAPGVAWNGLVAVSSTPQGGEFRPNYQDGVKTFNSVAPQEFSARLDAYTYPDEFSRFNGELELASGFYVDEQTRLPFGLSYKTSVGDQAGFTKGHHKVHLVYNALTRPTATNYQTMGAITEPLTFGWEISTTPISIPGMRPASHFVVDSRRAGPRAYAQLQDILYGTASTSPRLPTADELVSHFVDWNVLFPSSSTYPSPTSHPGAP